MSAGVRPISIFIVLWLTFSAVTAHAWTGQCVGVSDGDTISVLYEGKAVKVRLYGIDCPERGQPYGTKAKQFTSGLVFRHAVDVRPVSTDRYGRIIADVLMHIPTGRVSVSRGLVQHGLAWWYHQYAPGDLGLQSMEIAAKRKRIGLWRDPAPIPPWEWRRTRKAPK